MDDRDKNGRFLKQSRREQYKLLHERLAAELARERRERQTLELCKRAVASIFE